VAARPQLLACIAAALLAVMPASALAAERDAPWRPFAADSIWNLQLRSDVPLNPKGERYVQELARLVRTRGGWLNDKHCSMPMYWASGRTRTTAVDLDGSAYRDPRLLYAWRAVPIPDRARPAECSDSNMAVALRRRDGRISVWEFWRITKSTSGGRTKWRARWGGYTDDVRYDRGIASSSAWHGRGPTGGRYRSDAQWNVTASSVSMIAGVITRQDLAAGHIDHALSMAVTDTARGAWFFPAQRTDGSLRTPSAIPAGAHFRLDPSVDVDSLQLTPLVRMIAKAAQRYGIVVRDRTYGPNVFYTDGRPGEPSRADALLDGKAPNVALKAFPWEKLQLVDAPLCVRKWGRCEVEPKVRIHEAAQAASRGTAMRLDTSNSSLNQPRRSVEWDLDGDGSYETSTGRRIGVRLPSGRPLPERVRVRITTADGSVVTGSRRLTVTAQPNPQAGGGLFGFLERSVQVLADILRRASDPDGRR
jgi:hypothetical protein